MMVSAVSPTSWSGSLIPSPAVSRYEPVDAKLARSEGKPGHVLQLCFYAEALEALTGAPPKSLHLWLGSGRMESLVSDEFRAYWNRIRRQLAALVDPSSGGQETAPEPCPHCEFCEFREVCTAQWRETDSLIYVAGIRRTDRDRLEADGIESLGGLATVSHPVPDLRPERLERLVGQATLQVEARDDPDRRPPFRIVEPTGDAVWGHGFELLPAPDGGDVFLDFEGDPFWRADAGLFFLFGLIALAETGIWQFRPSWAHGREEEATATAALIEYLAGRRTEFPDMHVYHYNHTERSALESLSAEHGVHEALLAELIETGLFVDLYPIAGNSIQAGTESYGLKDLERLTGYQRGHDIDQGSAAVVEYEQYMVDHDPDRLARIGAYNEDDVRSTLALRDWLVEQRPMDLAWRAALSRARRRKPGSRCQGNRTARCRPGHPGVPPG